MARRLAGVWGMLVSLSVMGCATVPMASPADDARMKAHVPGPDTALIYVYRNEMVGFGVHMDVDLDGRPYGATVAKSYMVWEVPPGQHVLVSHAENDASLVVYARPGTRTYVWQEVRMGVLFARSSLEPVPEPVGVAGVSECRLIAMPLPRPRPVLPPPPPPVYAPPAS